MDVASTLVVLLALVVAFGSVARRIGVAAPLVLVVAGLGISYVPFLPDVALTPDLVLIGLLPPLLYATAIRMPLIDVRRELTPILGLSVGLVLLTTAVVGLLVWWLLPVPLAAAVAIGAVVAPPDAVAATAVARRVGLPRRMTTVLEGESLLNDATAIVTLRAAIAALSVGLSVVEVAWSFVVSAGGGVLIGLLVALVVGRLRRRVQDDLTDVSISFLTPWVAYLPAEQVEASGVIAVVVAGLVLGARAPFIQTASSRLFERTNWTTISFLLENTVFVLIGMQVRTVVSDLDDSALPLSDVVLVCAAVLVAVMVVRFVAVTALLLGPRLVGRGGPGLRAAAVVGWAGMRGVVTLAAAFLLPATTPERSVLVLVAFVVTVGTLLLQGTTLPFVVRRLGVRGPDVDDDRRRAAGLAEQATRAGLDRLDAALTGDEDPEIVERLRTEAGRQADRAASRRDGPDEALRERMRDYARLRLAMIDAERAYVLRARRADDADQAVVNHVLDRIDAEETVITRRGGSR